MTNRAADLDALAARLPDPEALETALRALAATEAVRHERWRMCEFDATKPYGSMGRYSNGAGDEFSVHFLAAGTFIRTFDHESDLSPWAREPAAVFPGLLEPVPDTFLPVLTDRELLSNFRVIPVTGTFWRLAGDTTWSHGHALDPRDGSPWSEDAGTWADRPTDLTLTADDYTREQEDNGNPVDAAAFAHVWAHRPLTQDIVDRLSAEWWDTPPRLEDLADDLRRIGYPLA